jgi:AhpD family alkylhydroperoxidase
MNYEKLSEKTIKHMYAARASLSESPLSQEIQYLVELRSSQINGCAYCCALHCQDARKVGISQQKLDELAGWQTSSHFDEKEKMALCWCEAVTYIHSPQTELRAELKKFFDDREIVDLTIAIAQMNAFNRIAIHLKH